MDHGWVKLHRKIFENKLWLSEPFTKAQAWIDLFANANHENGSFWVRGNEVKIKRGQVGWSEVTMAKRWQWSRMKVRRYLKQLESDTQVRQQKIHKITSIITIIKYDDYQQRDIKLDNRRDNRRDTNKNNKNDKKNTYIAATDAPRPLYTFENAIKALEDSPRRDLNIIALYLEKRRPDIRTREQMHAAIKRHIRAAKSLVPFQDDQIIRACREAEREYPKMWTIETLVKILTK